LEAVDAPAGVVIWGHDGAPVSMLLLVSFLVRPQDRFFVPTCAGAMTPRAGAVKAGRRSWGVACSGLRRPRLDGAEHGVMLGRVGTAAIASPAAL
jgi:hypothetical protein